MRQLQHLFARSYLARFVAVAVTQAVVLKLSLYLVPAGTTAGLVWPPAAIGLAALWFWGFELWPALVAAFMAVLITQGIAPPLAVGTALANAAESLVATYILRNYVGFDPMLNRLRDAMGLVLAAVIGSVVSASIITAAVSLYGGQSTLSSPLWVAIWVGHTVSLLSFGAFALRWLCRPQMQRSRPELLEGVILFGSIAMLSFLMTWTPYTSVGGVSLTYLLIIPLIWAALRTGPRGISLGLFLFALITSSGLVFGYHPDTVNTAQALFGFQMVIGALSLIFLLFTSITEERKEAVLALEGHVGQLETALERISTEDKAKTDFIAILAHELRNPLSPLLSGIELLKLRSQGPDEVLRMMGAHLHTIARLLDDLLDISRITQKKFKLQKQAVEVRQVVSQTLEMVEPYYKERGHTLETHLPQEEIWLNADPVRLGQIFVNLLNNAAKYTPQGGRISLTVVREGPILVAKVKDNGQGIAQDRLEKIFEAFGGVNPGIHAQAASGLRIGLSLARRMAQMHHGTIEVSSAGEGKGAEFTVKIPLPDTAPLPLGESSAHGVRPRERFTKEILVESRERSKRLCVLVVDDNEPAAQNLGKLLEHNGHKVLLAYDAPQALEVAEREQPDVALLDIGLPTMDGYELAKRMRLSAPDVALVALTGYGQTDDRQKSKQAGFSEHLIKPASIVDVERVLSDLTSKRQGANSA